MQCFRFMSAGSSGVGAPLTRHSLKRCTTAAGSLAAMTASSNMQVPIVVSASDAMAQSAEDEKPGQKIGKTREPTLPAMHVKGHLGVLGNTFGW